jgi:TPR repeat protein
MHTLADLLVWSAPVSGGFVVVESDLSFDDAYAAWDKGDSKTAFRLFKACAIAGDHGCQINLGHFYGTGLGTAKSLTEEMHWYLVAQRNDDSAAASNVAIMHRNAGRQRQAYVWFKRAFLMDDGDAAVEIGKCYLLGAGVRRQPARAVAYLRKAIASQRITEAGREEAWWLSKFGIRRASLFGDRMQPMRKMPRTPDLKHKQRS